jgi:hypothetical protein
MATRIPFNSSGQRARNSDVPQRAQPARPHAARRPNQHLLGAARAVIGADRYRQHAAKEDQQNLRAIAIAEPDRRDRDQGRFRQGVGQFDDRIEQEMNAAPPCHRDSDSAADKDRERKSGNAANY